MYHVERVRMLRVLAMTKAVDGQSMETSIGGIYAPVVPIREAESAPHSLVECNTVDKELQCSKILYRRMRYAIRCLDDEISRHPLSALYLLSTGSERSQEEIVDCGSIA